MRTHPSAPIGLGHTQWLAVVLLLAFVPVFTGCPPDRVEPVEPVDDPPITSVSQLVDVMDPLALEGREVRLLNVRVVEVLGDTAFYVSDDRMAPAPAPGAPQDDAAFPEGPDSPALGEDEALRDPAAPGAPAAPGVAGQQQDRVLVVWDTGLLGDVTPNGQNRFRETVRVGANVDVFGQVRTWNGQPRPGVQDRPAPATQADPADPADPDRDPAATPAQPTQPAQPMGTERVFVDADRVERHDPARAAEEDPAFGDATRPGAQGADADGY